MMPPSSRDLPEELSPFDGLETQTEPDGGTHRCHTAEGERPRRTAVPGDAGGRRDHCEEDRTLRAVEAIQAGVSGYLLNNLSADELVNAARLVLGKAQAHSRLEAVSSTQPDPPPLPPAASLALGVPIQQAEDVPTRVGKPPRRQSGSRSHVV